MSNIIEKINKSQLKADRGAFNVGDTICVHTIVKEGDKERVQKFTGIVMGFRGTDINANFTVRRISYGEGVEKVFPVNSPNVEKIEVEKNSEIGRARLEGEPRRIGRDGLFEARHLRATHEGAGRSRLAAAGELVVTNYVPGKKP
jgi:large subunit ribosomal protein L19